MVTGSHRRSLKLLLAMVTAALLLVATALPAAALTVTFVRHGESTANASGTIDNSIPGAHLTPLGQTQSQAVAAALAADGTPYDAIYASNMVRTTETAAPFAAATGLAPVVLPGFREINAGWFEGWSDAGLGGIGYVLSPALWTLGARSLPIPGGGDGNAFDARVDEALQLVEESGAQNPVVFSHAATIMFWTMMNVDNPDLGLMLFNRLHNTDVVVVEGSAEEGWTLKSWAGREVGPADLPTKLLVNFRDLVETPQTAAYNVVRAFHSGDIGTIAKALRDGVGDVLRAPVEFVAAVARDVADAVTGALRPRVGGPAGPLDTAAPPAETATQTTAFEEVPAADAAEVAQTADRTRVEAAEPITERATDRTPLSVRKVRTAERPSLRAVNAGDKNDDKTDDKTDDKADEKAGDETRDKADIGPDSKPAKDDSKPASGGTDSKKADAVTDRSAA